MYVITLTKPTHMHLVDFQYAVISARPTELTCVHSRLAIVGDTPGALPLRDTAYMHSLYVVHGADRETLLPVQCQAVREHG